jgi:N-acetylated-alpha-linked acidic dipeptidase
VRPLEVRSSPLSSFRVSIGLFVLECRVPQAEESAQNYEASMNALYSASQGLRSKAEKSPEGILMKTERALTQSAGLPLRPSIRHQVYAPGAYTGYGVKTLRGVREAIERLDWNETNGPDSRKDAGTFHITDEIARATKTVKQHRGSQLNDSDFG